jgi:NAD(P)-dependent dehydrogenase (short-subunit alcohol dehydrogenase family)
MKVAVITGAANGIGLALTQVYLQKGNQVLMVDCDEAKLKTQAQSFQAEYPDQVLHKTCDVRQIAEVMTLARYVKETLGRVDWLYNNAGIIGQLGPIWELDIQTVHEVMDVNVYGMIHVIQAFIPLLLNQHPPSHIINMASLYALCAGSQTAAYSMSKHAVLALSESLYFDLKPLEKPINISVVFPSFTDTGLLSTPTQTTNTYNE